MSPPTVSWPPSGLIPINEFNTEGYISCAFPTLFPTGAADFVAPCPLAVIVGNYFKHLLLYQDGRFARHPRFRYFALNTEMRWRALQAGRIYIRQHPLDAQLSVEELRDMVVVKERLSPTECCTMPPAYVERGSTGSSSGAGSLPWWIHSVCPQCFSPTAQLTSSGQSSHDSSVLTTRIPAPATARPSRRTLPLLTGSSTIASTSSSMLSTLVFLDHHPHKP